MIEVGRYYGALKVVAGPCSKAGRWLCRCVCGRLRRLYACEITDGTHGCGDHRGGRGLAERSDARRAADMRWKTTVGIWGHPPTAGESPDVWGLGIDDYVEGHALEPARVAVPPETDEDWRARVAERGSL